ncbi:uncharacterized protein isoform X2 [Rhodnius prolixus]
MAATATAKNEHVFTTNSTSSPPPEILETATNFVDEVIKEAEEIARKKQGLASEQEQEESSGLAAIIKRGTRWQNRARGIVTRFVGFWRDIFGSRRRNNCKGD